MRDEDAVRGGNEASGRTSSATSDGPDFADNVEIVDHLGEQVLAYPRGRHAQIREARVSICVPIEPGRAGLEATCDSVAAQTGPKPALLLVDGHTQDGGFQAACRFVASHGEAIAYQTPRALAGAALWNRCLALASGTYTKLLLPGDVLAPDFLAKATALLDTNEETMLVTTGRPLKKGEKASGVAGGDPLARALLSGDPPGPLAGQLWRRSAITAHDLRFRADVGERDGLEHELGTRLLALGGLATCPDALCTPGERRKSTRTACESFRRSCEASLGVLRGLPIEVGPLVLTQLLDRVVALYREHEARATKEGDEGVLHRAYAVALDELVRRLRRATAAGPSGDRSTSGHSFGFLPR